LLNRGGVAQISPTSTAVGLTSGAAGAAPGEPQKYYPTGARTYARVVPNDSAQAAAMVKLQLGVGCKKTYVLEDGEVDGQDLATTFELAARSSPLQVVAVQMFDRKATDYSSLASAVAQTGANCVLISAITENHAVLLTKQLAAALPRALIFGASGMAESTYTNPQLGGIPPALDSHVLITVATLDPSAYPPGARAFLSAYAQRYGSPEPSAIFGYEAMSLMLNAITRATDHGTDPARRSKIVAALFGTRDRHSVLGTYSIDRDGDTTLTRYGVYRVVAGQLTFWKAIEA
jgi:branched-chain amino acid transport system substrate-binding protein